MLSILPDLSKVVIADRVAGDAVALLSNHGFVVVNLEESGVNEDRLIQVLTENSADALIVRSATKVTEKVLTSGVSTGLRVVARAGVGVDNIDVRAAEANGVLVINAPDGNTLSAAEHTCVLILCLSRQLPSISLSKPDDWFRNRNAVTSSSSIVRITELSGKTLGIVGLGRIGSAVGKRMFAFGMRIIGHDPRLMHKPKSYIDVPPPEWLDKVMPLEELLAESDYITLHIPLNASTKGLIGPQMLAKCRKGFRLINCSRGSIVDEAALLDTIDSGHCAGAALDVFTTEPVSRGDRTMEKLLAHPCVICTPHLGASSCEAQIRVAMEVSEALLALAGKSKLALSGLEGAINMNPIGRDCLAVFQEWSRCANRETANILLTLPYAFHALFELLLQQLGSGTVLLKDASVICRISLLIPEWIKIFSKSTCVLIYLFAHAYDVLFEQYTSESISSSEKFNLLSAFFCNLSYSPITSDTLTGLNEISWISKGKTRACSCQFLHPNSHVDAVKHVASSLPVWTLSIVYNCIRDSDEVTLSKPVIGQLDGAVLHLLNENGVRLNKDITLHNHSSFHSQLF